MRTVIILFTASLGIMASYKPLTNAWQNMAPADAAKELKELQAANARITDYSVNIAYNTFDEKGDKAARDKSDGYVIRRGPLSKSRLLGIYSVQDEKLRVTIDSAGKLVQVANAFKTELPGFSLNDYVKILGFCKSIKKANVNNIDAYRFETKNTEGVLAQEVYLEKGVLKEADVYYANEHTWRENNTIMKEIVYPRLQVIFSDFKMHLKLPPEYFSTGKIVTVEGKTLKLAAGYKNYKLIDGRIDK